MQRTLIRFGALAFVLQAAALAAACSTSSSSPALSDGGSGGSATGGASGGSGGAGGVMAPGGAGGSGGDGCEETTGDLRLPERDLPPQQQWLGDRCAWQPLPDQQDWPDYECTYWEADPERIEMPQLAWESCGDGCAKADVLQGHGTTARFAALGISSVKGMRSRPFLTFNQAQRPPGNYTRTLFRVIDLAEGSTESVVQSVAQVLDFKSRCSDSARVLAGTDLSASRIFPYRDETTYLIRGTWNRSARNWIWKLPWPTIEETGIPMGWCDLVSMEDGGRTFWLCMAGASDGVYAATTPGSSNIELLDSPFEDGFTLGRGDALGDLAIWAEIQRADTGSRVRGWRPDGKGIRTLLDDIPVDTCAVGLSDARVAGFSTAGACAYFNPEGRLWVADRGPDDTLTNLRLGPIFSDELVAEPEPVKVWGDYIAAVWGPEEYENRDHRRQLLLARTTDWAMRNLKAPPEHEVYRAVLTDDYLYVVFSGAGGATYAEFDSVHRYELAKFDQIGDPVDPVPEPAVSASRERP